MRRKSVLGGGNSINKRGRGDQVCSGKRRGPGCLEPSECGVSRDGAGGRAGPALRAQAALSTSEPLRLLFPLPFSLYFVC